MSGTLTSQIFGGQSQGNQFGGMNNSLNPMADLQAQQQGFPNAMALMQAQAAGRSPTQTQPNVAQQLGNQVAQRVATGVNTGGGFGPATPTMPSGSAYQPPKFNPMPQPDMKQVSNTVNTIGNAVSSAINSFGSASA